MKNLTGIQLGELDNNILEAIVHYQGHIATPDLAYIFNVPFADMSKLVTSYIAAGIIYRDCCSDLLFPADDNLITA